ncbi:HD domain-containing protein [Ponticaulis sp.]|uniref:HD domain-containing protein n=1 Tax=Ponticaulis sp. TaxID=2020902 RepID=UPI000B67D3F8|nr:HD domain-containing protein [Ponticaulis sp.]MAI91807.1 phosphohydrolase [Ponticaulis sp.]OUX96678.1 MAG: phosphohydrolase [Hyphomonadaceae bacterium TMED5]|tara:strand:- start:3688 stop:4281 length:594 start_codon:yes stop_codon:yes gene_type:complete
MADGHDGAMKPRAKFKTFVESSQDDWKIIATESFEFNKGLADRVLEHLRILKGDYGGFPIDRLEHSLQTATRALRDGRDEEYVVCALLHDIGDTLGSYNHPDIAAAILKPFVSEQNHWMVANHGIFQGYYFFEHLGLDKNMRDQYQGHPHFEYTAQFCHLYDQAAFDPDYESETLEFFEPMVRRVFEKPKQSIYKKK